MTHSTKKVKTGQLKMAKFHYINFVLLYFILKFEVKKIRKITHSRKMKLSLLLFEMKIFIDLSKVRILSVHFQSQSIKELEKLIDKHGNQIHDLGLINPVLSSKHYKDLSIHQLFTQHLCVFPKMSMKMGKNDQVL